MSPSRLILVAMVLACRVGKCEAKPLSIDGIALGQKWGEFLQVHPKVEVFTLFDDSPLTKAQQLALEAKKKDALLAESHRAGAFPDAFYDFHDGSLSREAFFSHVGVGPKERNLASLKEPLNTLLAELGTPTAQGVTPRDGFGEKGNQMMLVWKTPSQCAFARVDWPLTPRTSGPVGIEVQIVNVTWRNAKPGFPIYWPAVVVPDKEALVHKQQFTVLLEKLRPGSTGHIGMLQVASAIDLTSPQGKKP